MSNRPVVANLDFDSVKQDIIEFYKSKDEFKDYNFEGSSLNLLIDMLAYNTHYNSLTANMMFNEMFLDSAVQRSNAVSIAKALNYTPRSVTSATSTVNITIPRAQDPDGGYTEPSFTLPAGTVFTAAVGNSSSNFYTVQDYTIQFDPGATSNSLDVVVHEGQIFSQRFVQETENASFSSFEILSDTIDITTLSVSVNGTTWSRVKPETEGITAANSVSTIYMVEENRNGRYNIVFGNGVIGKDLQVGDSIVATFVASNGVDGNGISNFTVTVPNRNVTINRASISAGGAAKETLREIKDNAPHWFQSQYRAVTENDYITLIRSQYSDIQSINVYGGEKVNQPGKVFIAIRPASADVLTDIIKETIVNDLLKQSNVVTIVPTVVDPDYTDIIVKTTLAIDTRKLQGSIESLGPQVQALYRAFDQNYIGDFLINFYNSQLTQEIYKLDESIVSVNSRVSLSQTVKASRNSLEKFIFNFNNRFYHPYDGYKVREGGVLSTNLFSRNGGAQLSGFDDDGSGNVRLYDFTDNQKVYVTETAGVINYDTGVIEILTAFSPDDGEVRFTVVPESFDVLTYNNMILRIAADRSSVNVVDSSDHTLLKSVNTSRSA